MAADTNRNDAKKLSKDKVAPGVREKLKKDRAARSEPITNVDELNSPRSPIADEARKTDLDLPSQTKTT
jgi:hypothetical protein